MLFQRVVIYIILTSILLKILTLILLKSFIIKDMALLPNVMVASPYIIIYLNIYLKNNIKN